MFAPHSKRNRETAATMPGRSAHTTSSRAEDSASGIMLLLDELLEARSLFECGETGRLRPLPAPAGEIAAAAGSRDRGGCADEASDHEGARTCAPVATVHETIVRVRIATL